jgi:putative DNA primase/helicase
LVLIMSSIPIRYSRGQSKYDNTPEQREAADFDAFETEVLSERSKVKGLDYICGPLSYGDHDDPNKHPGQDHFRLATHAEPKAFLCLDHDEYNSPDIFRELMSDLERFRGFGYTTFSSTESNPRCRIVLQLNREINRTEGIALGASVDQMLERVYGAGAISSDITVHRSEQPCYLPGEDSEIFHFPGEPLDVHSILSMYPAQLHQAPTNRIIADAAPSERYARLTPQSLEMVLRGIEPSDEPTWFAVACGLARVYGESGRTTFIEFSEGRYWSAPYPNFSVEQSNSKYNSALEQVARRPKGFGMRHLISLAGLNVSSVRFEDNPPSNASGTLQSSLVLPCLSSRNKPLPVTENLDAVLAAAGVIARYNQIKKRQEIIVPGLRSVSDEVLNSSYTAVTDLALKAGLPANRVAELLDALASQSPFCPVQTYVLSHEWDGISRFQQFLGQMRTSTPSMATRLWRKWLIQAVAAAFEPDGIANAGVMILSGDQGIGKTRLLRDLNSGIPGVFAEGVTLNPADKDSVLNSISHWVVELGELEATFKKADIAQLKAFITRQIDTVRRPYARKESNLVRRTVFAGTVNDLHCLHDQTGNRRFWPLSVESINIDPTIDYQQLWAEVYNWYQAGEKWYLTASEQADLEVHCEVFMVDDPDIEALLDAYPFYGCTTWEKLTMQEICKNIGIEKPNKGQTMRLAEAIRRHNGGQKPHRSNGVSRHFVPDTRDYAPDTDPKASCTASMQTPENNNYAANSDPSKNYQPTNETPRQLTKEQLIAKWKNGPLANTVK